MIRTGALGLAVTLALAALLAAGCGPAPDEPHRPGRVVDDFWRAVQAGDMAAAARLAVEDVDPAAIPAHLLPSLVLGNEGRGAFVRRVLLEVRAEDVVGERAEVLLVVTAPDLDLLAGATADHIRAGTGPGEAGVPDPAFIAALDVVESTVTMPGSISLVLSQGRWKVSRFSVPALWTEELDRRLTLALGPSGALPPLVEAEQLLRALAEMLDPGASGPSILGMAAGLPSEASTLETPLGRLDLLRLPGEMPLGAWESSPGVYTLFPWCAAYEPEWGRTRFMTGKDFLLAIDAGEDELALALLAAGAADMQAVVLDPVPVGSGPMTHWAVPRAAEWIYPRAPGNDVLMVYVGDIDFASGRAIGHNLAKVTGDRHRVHVMFSRPRDPGSIEVHADGQVVWLDSRSLVVEVPAADGGSYAVIGIAFDRWHLNMALDVVPRQRIWSIDMDTGLPGPEWLLHQPLSPLGVFGGRMLLARDRGTYASCELVHNVYDMDIGSGGLTYVETATGWIYRPMHVPGVLYSLERDDSLLRLDCRGAEPVISAWTGVQAADPSGPGAVVMIAGDRESAGLVELRPEAGVERTVITGLPPAPRDPFSPSHSVFALDGGRAVLVLRHGPEREESRWLAVNLDTGETLEMEQPEGTAGYSWHRAPLADGSYVLMTQTRPGHEDNRHLSLAVDLDTGDIRDLALPSGGRHTWSPDAGLVHVQGSGVYDAGGTLVAEIPGSPALRSALWSPCGEYLATEEVLWHLSGGTISPTGGRPVGWDGEGLLWFTGPVR